MADQASVNGGRSNGSSEGVVGSIAGFGNDVATLAELQAKLAVLDFKESAEKATIPLGIAAVGLTVLLGCVPVAVAALGLLVAQWLGWTAGEGLILVSVAVMVLAGVAVAVALTRIPRSFDSFRRSMEELNRNISWIRTVLVQSSRSAARRR